MVKHQIRMQNQRGAMRRPEREFEEPGQKLQKKIRSQIEFYFSDKNLKRHHFLVDKIRHSDGGYVSLKLLTTFHEVKTCTMDYRVVAYSLRASKCLEVNETATLVRRRVPVPNRIQTVWPCNVLAFNLPFQKSTASSVAGLLEVNEAATLVRRLSVPNRIQTAQPCKVLAFNLPFQKSTASSVAELFEPFGKVNFIHLLRPGNTIPPVFGKAITDYIKQLNEVCALIEFDKHEAAMKAVAKLKNKDVCKKGMRVVQVSALGWFYRQKKIKMIKTQESK